MPKPNASLCNRGHRIALVGTYRIGKTLTCRKCHRDGIEASRARKLAERNHPEEILPSEMPRLMSKIDVRQDDPESCWEWLAATSKLGYGHFTIAGRLRLAHRVVYRALVGPIPDGLVIDHLCLNKRCVNPAHLEAVTQAENMARAKPQITIGVRRYFAENPGRRRVG